MKFLNALALFASAASAVVVKSTYPGQVYCSDPTDAATSPVPESIVLAGRQLSTLAVVAQLINWVCRDGRLDNCAAPPRGVIGASTRWAKVPEDTHDFPTDRYCETRFHLTPETDLVMKVPNYEDDEMFPSNLCKEQLNNIYNTCFEGKQLLARGSYVSDWAWGHLYSMEAKPASDPELDTEAGDPLVEAPSM